MALLHFKFKFNVDILLPEHQVSSYEASGMCFHMQFSAANMLRQHNLHVSFGLIILM